MRIDLKHPLDAQITAVQARIDAGAEAERLKYLTPGSAQAMVYLHKSQRAREFLAAYPDEVAAEAASPEAWPLMAAEVGITADSMWGVAQTVIMILAEWEMMAAKIEMVRLGAKRQVELAPHGHEINAIERGIAWPALGDVTVRIGGVGRVRRHFIPMIRSEVSVSPGCAAASWRGIPPRVASMVTVMPGRAAKSSRGLVPLVTALA